MKQGKKKNTSQATTIKLITKQKRDAWLKGQSPLMKSLVEAHVFKAEPGEYCIMPGTDKEPAQVIAGIAEKPDLWSIAGLPEKLPAGDYALEETLAPEMAEQLYLGWLLGTYRFSHYKSKTPRPLAALAPPTDVDAAKVRQIAEAIYFARDLINTPANDMGPEELAGACKHLAKTYKAHYSEIVGYNLVKEKYPAIYAVGRASTRAPRLVDIKWGNIKHPKVTLVGKGVCFDTGGLDIKPSSGMKLMKKDMGGAACVLALAKLIMANGLPVRLRVLIPAVENSIAGNAYRPSDVIDTRKGLTVEVGNTDAEGRLVLCDALYEADKEKPALLLDCATLTGAARIAVGTEIPAFFTPSDSLADALSKHATAQLDPLWRLPLWEGYREMLNSTIADINSAPDSSYAGSITAALYLKEFVTETTEWAHIDMMAWNLSKRPGRPAGGEAMAVRALYSYISERFGN